MDARAVDQRAVDQRAVETECCWRCTASMEWRHGTWQCPRCRFKLGCCEGEPQTCTDAAPARAEETAARNP